MEPRTEVVLRKNQPGSRFKSGKRKSAIDNYSHPLHGRFLQLAHGSFRIAGSKHGRAGHDDLSSGTDHFINVIEIDAPVDLDARLKPAFLNHRAQAPDLIQRSSNKFLAAETRIHRHQQNIISELERVV